ncbi:hypothetical protein CJU90_4990 [Yarrowia sp. C11]|nr:hypothetical protein CJU90_4990 [Yarrowia sp. C11]KAG5364793.1 hypothetical protein CKK34_3618 [Yarrowia sp. E02]
MTTQKGLLQRVRLYRKRVEALEAEVRKLESSQQAEKDVQELVQQLLVSNNEKIDTQQLEGEIGAQLNKEITSNRQLQTAFHTLKLSIADSYWTGESHHVSVIQVMGQSFQCRVVLAKSKEKVTGLTVEGMDMPCLKPFVSWSCRRKDIIALFGGLARYDELSISRFRVFERLSRLQSASFTPSYSLTTAAFKSPHVTVVLEWRLIFPMDIGMQGKDEDGDFDDQEDDLVSKMVMHAYGSAEYQIHDQKQLLKRVPVVFDKLVKLRGVTKAAEILVRSLTMDGK